MNYSRAIFLISDDVRAVHVSYEDGSKPTAFKTMDQTLQVDDLVVVETGTRWGMTVCRVTEIDVNIDLESTADLAWIVCKVPANEHESLKEQEAAAIKKIQSAEKRRKRDDLRKALIDDANDGLKELPIYSIKNE